MSYYPEYDLNDDPRFKEDARVENNPEIDEDKFEVERDIEEPLEREEDSKNEQLKEAYEIIREELPYDRFVDLQQSIRAGNVSNDDILNMARELSK